MYKRVNRHEKILQAVNGNASSLMQEALSGFQDQEKLASVLWAMGQYKTVANTNIPTLDLPNKSEVNATVGKIISNRVPFILFKKPPTHASQRKSGSQNNYRELMRSLSLSRSGGHCRLPI
mgnify:CR=1 FL=1